jgi:hypothetical protein
MSNPSPICFGNQLTINQAGKIDVKDDRPAENLSFAATNLVKPGLQSKRQQSEPPLNRNVFPPTPPPESERSSGSSPGGANLMSRGASVRNGPKPMPAKLNIEKARPQERYEIRDDASSRRAPPQRAASQGPTRSTREESRSRPQRSDPPRRRQSEDEEEDEYPGELYDMYRNSRGAKSSGGRSRNQPRYIEEEEEYASDYDDGSFDENDFEMVSKAPPRSRAPSRAPSRMPEIRKIRVKVHSEDIRYLMIGPAIEFPDLVDRVREKFGLRKRFKIRVRDDDMPNGDMITMGDQDDLDMAIMTVKATAKRERLDMGKMEVRITLHSHCNSNRANMTVDLDPRDLIFVIPIYLLLYCIALDFRFISFHISTIYLRAFIASIAAAPFHFKYRSILSFGNGQLQT